MAATTGSCLCQAVKYEVSGKPLFNALCFCNNCRKSTGSIGMANSWYSRENLKIVQGEDQLRTYADTATDSGATVDRSFCVRCGSPVVAENKTKFPGAVIITLGTMQLSDSEDWEPGSEYFCKRKVPWIKTPEGTKKFMELV